jgi:outer membrane protein TolC
VQRRVVALETELKKIGEARCRKGLLPLQEVEKISIDLENENSRLVDAQVAADAADARLAELLGHARVVRTWPWKTQLAQREIRSLVDAELKVQERPDWKAAQLAEEREGLFARRAFRLMAPSLDASYRYGYYDGASSATTQPLHAWTAGLTVSFPLFNRLSDLTAYKTQRLSENIASLNREQVERSARSEWTTARDALVAALRSTQQRDKTLERSRSLYRDNRKRLEGGRVSANELAIDQGRLFSSEQLAIQAWHAAHLAYSQLCHSLGRSVFSCVR